MLATPDDVTARLRRELTGDEADWIEGLLEEASVEVTEFCGQSFDPVPDTVRMVTSRVAARALDAPSGQAGVGSVTQQAGPYQVQRQFTPDSSSGGVYLTKSDKRKLAGYSITAGVFSIGMS